VSERYHAEQLLLQLSTVTDPEERNAILKKLLGSLGENTTIRSSFFCDYGYNIHLGCGVFLNANCVLLDVMPIHIGDHTQIGPAVQIYAADHPRDAETRMLGLECGKSVYIGKNVWIGGGAIILPGVRIEDHAVIGAGSVVTRDVAFNQRVAGNPARPLQAKKTESS
jgi:maltose O-acetyltransferase